MKRPLPAAILSAILLLVDARQKSRHESFSVQTFAVGGDRYHMVRSNDLRTVTVRFEPDREKLLEIRRRIEQKNNSVAQLLPVATQRPSAEDSDRERKMKRAVEAKTQADTLRLEIKALSEEASEIQTGWREEYSIVELAEQKLFTLSEGEDVVDRASVIMADRDALRLLVNDIREALSLEDGEDVVDAVGELDKARETYEELTQTEVTARSLGLENQIEACARDCHYTNMLWCQSMGDDSQKPWGDAEEWQRQSAIAGVKFFIANPGAPASAQHDAWMADKLADGWVYGEVKDAEKKTHPCLVPYEQLPIEQRAKDALFQAVCRAHFPEDPFNDLAEGDDASLAPAVPAQETADEGGDQDPTEQATGTDVKPVDTLANPAGEVVQGSVASAGHEDDLTPPLLSDLGTPTPPVTGNPRDRRNRGRGRR